MGTNTIKSKRNRVSTRSIILSLALALVVFGGCKDRSQEAQQPAPAERTEQPSATSPTEEAAPVQGVETALPAGRDDLFDADGKIRLRILCTTSPKEGRTDDFVAFLSEHFVEVATTDYQRFRQEDAEGFDVVIIDYGTVRPGSPIPEELSPAYTRATVTMGVAGSEVCRRLRLKPGYL
jgi:hypothetical protein